MNRRLTFKAVPPSIHRGYLGASPQFSCMSVIVLYLMPLSLSLEVYL
jgi:hypothetical protein